ncbi:MAG: methionine--tRNA ligase [Patescibacteria group bacterium]|jgi:methionyl-tRNA synthetase
MNKKIFIGVAWPYVNGDLHIGHLAGYLLPADIFARFQRFIGNDVLMVSGSDCYGTPITVEADKRGIGAEELVNEYHPKDVALFEKYRISYDLYTKTTTPNHTKVVQDEFVALAKNGYIYKDKTQQYYSTEENRFLPDRYVEGTCPHCGFAEARSDQCDKCSRVLESGELKNPVSKLTKKSVSMKETENYFLDWPKLQPFLEKYIVEKGPSWRPWVYEEAKGWLKKGLQPRAITRDMTWGVTIPVEQLPEELQIDDVENKRIYVWFDAVTGYLSASKEWALKNDQADLWKDWWYNKEAVHYYFMGKDNLVFHTLFWQGQLHGSDEKLHLPDVPVINNFLNLEGEKFSKSRGITIDSYYIAETYGVDLVRFYLTYIMPENSDANFAWGDFVDFNNGILIGKFGNFINRVLKLSENLKPTEDFKIDPKIKTSIDHCISKSYEHVGKCEFKLYAQAVVELAEAGNKYVAENEPWKLAKDSEEYGAIISNALLVVFALLLVTRPLIPVSNRKLHAMLGIDFEKWDEDVTVADLVKKLTELKITDPKPLFAKIDPEVVDKERAKISIKK